MNEYLDELLEGLGIFKDYQMTKEDTYVIDLADSYDYAKMYTILDNSDLVELNDDASTVTIENSNIVYESENFEINLISDFMSDTYKLIFTEV